MVGGSKTEPELIAINHKGFEPVEQIRNSDPNKKPLAFERLRICYPRMAHPRGFEPKTPQWGVL